MRVACSHSLPCMATIGRFPRPLQHSSRRQHLHSLPRPAAGKGRLKRPALPGKQASANSKIKLPPSEQQPSTSSASLSWRQRFPGDNGWDFLKLRKTDARTFNRFREVEVIHARWAMLGVLSLLVGDIAGSPFPPREATFSSLAPWGIVLLLSLALLETYRMAALWDEDDFEKRTYPGKRFDILGLTSPYKEEDEQPPGLGVWSSWVGGLPGWLAGGWWFERKEMTEAQLMEMKSRELRNGRLAMVSFIGCCMATALTGKGPISLLFEHLADPVHNTIVSNVNNLL